jgi:hypothetical protein
MLHRDGVRTRAVTSHVSNFLHAVKDLSLPASLTSEYLERRYVMVRSRAALVSPFPYTKLPGMQQGYISRILLHAIHAKYLANSNI